MTTVWSTPTGIAKDKTAPYPERTKAYLSSHTTTLNGVRITPTEKALWDIIHFYDLHGYQGRIVLEGMYTTPTHS